MHSHAKGWFLFLQLWALGRGAQADNLANEGTYDVVSASDIPFESTSGGRSTAVPRPLTTEEIKQYVLSYAQAAKAFVGAGGGELDWRCTGRTGVFCLFLDSAPYERAASHKDEAEAPHSGLQISHRPVHADH